MFLGRLVSLIAALTMATGCRESPGATRPIDLWAMGSEGEAVRQLIPDFEQQNPDVKVLVQQIPWSAAHEKLLTAFVGGALPDVFQVGNTWIPELTALGALDRLDERIASSTVVAPADYFRGILDTNIIEGSTRGIPWYVDTRLLFYRRDLLRDVGYEEAPTTWSTWFDAMDKLKQRAGSSGYAILLPFSEWQLPVILAMQKGSDLLRDDNRYGDFRSAAFRTAFEFYLQLFERGLAPHAGEAQAANIYQDFASGYFGFYVTGPWNLGEFRARLPESLQASWSTAPLPGPDAETAGLSVAGGSSLVVSSASTRKDSAWKLIEYFAQSRTQRRFYELTGDLPPRISAWEDPELQRDPKAKAFARQLERVRSTPKIPEWERIAARITQYAEAAARHTMTTDEALAALDHDTDAILEKRRWLLARAQTESRRAP